MLNTSVNFSFQFDSDNRTHFTYLLWTETVKKKKKKKNIILLHEASGRVTQFLNSVFSYFGSKKIKVNIFSSGFFGKWLRKWREDSLKKRAFHVALCAAHVANILSKFPFLSRLFNVSLSFYNWVSKFGHNVDGFVTRLSHISIFVCNASYWRKQDNPHPLPYASFPDYRQNR